MQTVTKLLVLVCLMGRIAVETDICSTRGEVDTTCPSDCSQLDPRVLGDRSVFNCTIGGINSINKFKEFNPSLFQPDTAKLFEAPKLRDIAFYKKTYPEAQQEGNPSLNINFLLPPGVTPPNKDEPVYPKAVLLKFESIADQRYQDAFYYDCPRHRIFRFHNYNPQSYYDFYNPRNLTFDCLVGLTIGTQLKVYKITLETVEGKSATYTVTVNVVVDDVAEWQPVVATEIDNELRSVYVVFERLDSAGVLGYIVQLLKDGQTQAVKQLPAKNNTVLFEDVPPGQYNVKVSVRATANLCGTAPLCMNATSYAFLVVASTDSVHYVEGAEDTRKVLLMVFGCLVGLALVLVICRIWLARRKKPNKQLTCGWLVHPYENDPDKMEVIDLFAEYLEETCRCKMLPLRSLEQSDVNVDERTLKDLCENTLSKLAKFVVIVVGKDSFNPAAPSPVDDFYSYSVRAAVDMKQSRNVIHIISVSFDFDQYTQLPSGLTKALHYQLMENSSELCVKILNFSEEHSTLQPLLPAVSERKRAVNEAIAKVTHKEHTAVKRELPSLPEHYIERKNHTTNKEHRNQTDMPKLTNVNMKSFWDKIKKINFQDQVGNGECEPANAKTGINRTEKVNDGYAQATEVTQQETRLMKPVTNGLHIDTAAAAAVLASPNIIASPEGSSEIVPSFDQQNYDCISEHTFQKGSFGSPLPMKEQDGGQDLVDSRFKTKSSKQNLTDKSHTCKQENSGYVSCNFANSELSHSRKERTLGEFDTETSKSGNYVLSPSGLMLENINAMGDNDCRNARVGHNGHIHSNTNSSCYVTQDQMLNPPSQRAYLQHGQLGLKGKQTIVHGACSYIPHEVIDELDMEESQDHAPLIQGHWPHEERCTHFAGSNYADGVPIASTESHAPYVHHPLFQADIHPSWKAKLRNNHQLSATESNGNYVPHDFANSQGMSQFSDNSEMHKLHDRLRYDVEVTGKAGPHYQHITGQYVAHHAPVCHHDYVGAEMCSGALHTLQELAMTPECTRGHETLPGPSTAQTGRPSPYIHVNNLRNHPDYIRPEIQRINSQSSDSIKSDWNGPLLSNENNVADFASQNYVTEQMKQIEADRLSSGYNTFSMERERPVGSSSITLHTQGACPMSTSSDSQSQPPSSSSANFLNALNVEQHLKADYENFEPIPPDEDKSSEGSIDEVIDKMEEFNSR